MPWHMQIKKIKITEHRLNVCRERERERERERDRDRERLLHTKSVNRVSKEWSIRMRESSPLSLWYFDAESWLCLKASFCFFSWQQEKKYTKLRLLCLYWVSYDIQSKNPMRMNQTPLSIFSFGRTCKFVELNRSNK